MQDPGTGDRGIPSAARRARRRSVGMLPTRLESSAANASEDVGLKAWHLCPVAEADRDMIRWRLKEPRMNRIAQLPESCGLAHPCKVSFSEVGNPNGFVVFLILGVDSHRYCALLFDDLARARGLRLLCLDRPGRGLTSNFSKEGTNRVLAFPEVIRSFCVAQGIDVFALLGQSLGATYALRVAQDLSGRVATTVYLISPWVPLSTPGANRFLLGAANSFPRWLLKGFMDFSALVPRLLIGAGVAGMMTKGCSEEEGKLLRSKATMEVLREIQEAGEQQHGLIQEALAALEKDMPLGFAYQEVAMPVHVFHGRADHMVPFRAVQWVGEAMPACTVSFKIGGSHALVFDTDVMDSVMEHLAQDYRVFLANRASVARDRRDGDGGSASPEQEPSTFPVHTQIFQKSGNLFVRRGMPFYQWQQRHFVLEGFRLFEFAKAGDANACRTIDLRLCRTTVLASAGVGGWAEHSSGLLFPFQHLRRTKSEEWERLWARCMNPGARGEAPEEEIVTLDRYMHQRSLGRVVSAGD